MVVRSPISCALRRPHVTTLWRVSRPAPSAVQLQPHWSCSGIADLRRSSSTSDPSKPTTLTVTSTAAPHTGTIRILSLDRPQARNALSSQLVAELRHQLDSIRAEGEDGPTRALVIGSAIDSSFCAGADLKERAGFTTEQTKAFLTALRETLSSLSTLPIPTISAVAAPALGGGLELALCTHLRVFASTAQVGLPETRLAILPGAGGTFRLPALIGEGRARDLILTGRRVGAAEAYFLGLCDRLVEVLPAPQASDEQPGEMARRARESALDQAVRLAKEICEGGPVAVRQALKAVRGWRDEGSSERKAYEVVLATQDRNEALAAFRDKRKPVYKGR